ncbi:SCO family protein [Methylobacterium sp. E-025]|uniref:SCO family protein n=1 Tax=Methylobacterium sp. E-025 TaxID=2836561 RepID=UPI001FBA1771|nr:SCO family protein [Methylobacterium sp. E-025]MCJ2112490.1 SCO family protein [Methylobacterium sp. E-025]
MPIDPPPVTPAQRRAGYGILAAVLVGILGIAGGVVAMLPRGPAKPAMSVVGGPFRLQSSKGGILDSATLAGRPFLVFFGFTRCPNVCPTTLADLSNLIDDLHKAGGDIGAYYITLDPERDAAAVLRDYMGSFSDSITGLTGTREEIDRVARSYRVFSKKVPLPGGDYTLEHTLMVYLMDRNGGFVGPLDLAAGHGLALRQIQAVL